MRALHAVALTIWLLMVSAAPSFAQQTQKSTYSKIINIDERITNIETEMSATNARQAANFEDQFGKLIQIIFAVMALSVTALIFIANTWIKDKVTALHDAELEKAKTKLNTLVNTANADVGANIYTTISGHCIDLYKNFDDPVLGGRHYDLYRSYVSMAVRIGANAYIYASRLEQFIESQPADSLTAAERKKYKKVIDYALNNYVFYLAQRSSAKDREILKDLLPKLVKSSADRKNAYEEKWWDFEDTIIWAKLNLDRTQANLRRKELIDLIRTSGVDADWQLAVRERYALYNKTCTHEAQMVHL